MGRGASNEYPYNMFSWKKKKKQTMHLSRYISYLEHVPFIPKVFGHLYFLPYLSSLRKHAYSNILKISPQKLEVFHKNSDIFSYFCSKHGLWVLVRTASPRRGGSNEYPQSMFLSRNKKNNVYPCKPQFYYMKVGFSGVKTI